MLGSEQIHLHTNTTPPKTRLSGSLFLLIVSCLLHQLILLVLSTLDLLLFLGFHTLDFRFLLSYTFTHCQSPHRFVSIQPSTPQSCANYLSFISLWSSRHCVYLISNQALSRVMVECFFKDF